MGMSRTSNGYKDIDEIRRIILRFFYDSHKNASSPKKVKMKITESKRALKELGINSKETVSNIDYLVGGDWLKKEEEQKQFTTKQGVLIPSITTYYKASNKTIDHFDKSKSIFRKQELGGINITNIQGVTNLAVGESNSIIVNSNFIDLHNGLDKLSNVIKENTEMVDEEKLNNIAEIETIKAQLMKPKPNKNIIKGAWDKLSKLVTVSGLIEIYQQIEPLIKVLL